MHEKRLVLITDINDSTAFVGSVSRSDGLSQAFAHVSPDSPQHELCLADTGILRSTTQWISSPLYLPPWSYSFVLFFAYV